MNRRAILSIPLLITGWALSSCASFSGAVVPEAIEPGALSHSTGITSDSDRKAISSSAEIVPPLKVRLQFTGWSRAWDTKAFQERLAGHGIIASDTADDLLVILLEQEETTSSGWRLLNLLATAWSNLILPFYNQVNRRIEYRLYARDQLRCQFAAHTRNDELIGILMLPVSPFFWPTRKQINLEMESADLFAARCLKGF